MPEIKAYMTKARLRRGIEIIKLANRIEALKMQEDEEGETQEEMDTPSNPKAAASGALAANHPNEPPMEGEEPKPAKRSLSAITKRAIFREVVLAKVREMKEDEKREQVEEAAKKKSGLQ